MDRTQADRWELLAPAGSYAGMTAAFSAGADAVYMGGPRFGARAYAENPDGEGVCAAIDFAHLHGKRLYLTVNTLLKEKELAELPAWLEPFYEQGLDAVIVQDVGVMSLIRRTFPDLPLHASTQMTVASPWGAKLAAKLGAKRLVLPRELSLAEIRAIASAVPDLEIEVFIHGALCYCYSGQCLLSSLIGGRSGNRGRCAQPCRLPYKSRAGEKKGRYLLNLKDLCSLDLLPDILEAGTVSLKIEGRMKSPRYAAGITHVYRKYLNRIRENGAEDYTVDPADRELLRQLFDRGGFTDGYFRRHNGAEMIYPGEKPRFREISEEKMKEIDRRFVEQTPKEPVSGTLICVPGKPVRLTVSAFGASVTRIGPEVTEAKKRPVSEADIRGRLEKTGASPFRWDRLEIRLGENAFLPMGALGALRRDAFDVLAEEICHGYRRIH